MQYTLFDQDELAAMYRTGDYIRSSKLALRIHWRLSRVYEIPEYYHPRLSPINQLPFAVLSQRTTGDKALLAFRKLCWKYRCWERVCDSTPESLQQVIADVNLAEKKAGQIIDMLRQLILLSGGGSRLLTACGTCPMRRLSWLQELKGVGPKSSAAVLIFSTMMRAVLPVNTHHKRIVQRTGLVKASLSDLQLHAWLRAQLPADWKAFDLYCHYYLIKRHGQRCCTVIDPACDQCPLLDLCEYGQAREGSRSSRRQYGPILN